MGHRVQCYEPLGAWSLTEMVRNEGDAAIGAIDQFRATFPQLDVRFYQEDSSFAEYAAQELRGADVVILHEWNDPQVVNTVLGLKEELGFRALFHDTHHRAYSNAASILRFQLHLVDGVLAFGDALRRIYKEGFGIPRVWTFHEAADMEHFAPLDLSKQNDVVWMGNWGDEGRVQELEEFVMGPARALRDRRFVVYGVGYPAEIVNLLKEAGVEYRGYLPNLSAANTLAQAQVTLHVPRRQYANGLSGIPTIRVFEALACGVPLVCSPWSDVEGLFHPGRDYLVASDRHAMTDEIEHLLRDDDARGQLAASGLDTIRKRHTCAHRAAQLTEIIEELG